MRVIPILFTFTENLAMPAGVCITSLLENADPETFYDIFILHNPQSDFSKSGLEQLPQHYHNCRITFRTVKGEFVGGFEIRNIPETAYYRLISPEIIPEYDKILYSDVDVIFRDDLSKYYELDLGDNYLAGVDNCSRLRPWLKDHIENELHLNHEDGFYYSGNLVINSALIRKDGKTKEFRELGKQKFFYQDMDIINIACNKRFLPLPLSFCLTVHLYDLIVRKRDDMAAIYGNEVLEDALKCGTVHYNGAKPWEKPCMNMDIWWDYYRRSIFFDEKFCHDFWDKQRNVLLKMPLIKRIKLLLRYPLDRMA